VLMKRAPIAIVGHENRDLVNVAGDQEIKKDVNSGYNTHLPLVDTSGHGALVMADASSKRRHLNCRLGDASVFFSSAIELYAKRLGCQIGNPTSMTSGKITTVGRITCEEKLTMKNAMLETGRGVGGGGRILLDFSKYLSPVSLFPGQIVGLEGENIDGTKFVVHRIIKPPSQSLDYNLTSPMKIAIACGPLTLDNDPEDFTPLEGILEKTFDANCDLLILFGPILNALCPSVQLGKMKKRPQEHYEHVLKRLELLTGNSHCTVLLPLSPIYDLLADPIFPMSGPLSSLSPNRVTYLDGPRIVEFNGLKIGINPVDVLMHLSAEEASMNVQGDRMVRLCDHLFEQLSFYPLYPAHPSLNIDYQSSEGWVLQSHPHIMLIPSILKPCAKATSSGSLFINPGRNLAVLSVHPGSSVTTSARVDFLPL
jgi:DNA polymerase alpha subunit B